MIGKVSKIIVRSIFGIVLILLVVESLLIVPAYISVVFNSQAVATKGARNNYITEEDIVNLKKNITQNQTNERFGDIDITTEVTDLLATRNTLYSLGDPLSNSDKLQRGESFELHVKATYYFLMPNIWQSRSATERQSGIPITIEYDITVTCLNYIKELD